ncbi:hypothetical protein Q5752_000115 [Cryptotrichosporon argae]
MMDPPVGAAAAGRGPSKATTTATPAKLATLAAQTPALLTAPTSIKLFELAEAVRRAEDVRRLDSETLNQQEKVSVLMAFQSVAVVDTYLALGRGSLRGA